MTAKKHERMHPYAAIDHRVMDSVNYQNLTHSAQSLLFILARQLNGRNNGQLQAAFEFAKKYGHTNERTLARSIKQLMHYGFIFRTRFGGYNRGPSLYAVTWHPIQDKTNIYPNGFEMLSFRKTQDVKTPAVNITIRKKTGAKTHVLRHAKRHLDGVQDAKIEAVPDAKTHAYVSVTIPRGIPGSVSSPVIPEWDDSYEPF